MLKSKKTKLFSYRDITGENVNVYSYIPITGIETTRKKSRRKRKL